MKVHAVAQQVSQQAAPEAPVVVKTPSVKFEEGHEFSFNEKVQIALARANMYDGPIDGKVGAKTREAIKAFQTSKGLKADGLAGPQTWEALRVYYYRESGKE
ncbi:MAG: peptidoglycan-binding protein [Candidatus Omnitrophica bacterium]|nr:peptidoglycan-binding protein [Candidatus Omnitrophota bacterium]